MKPVAPTTDPRKLLLGRETVGEHIQSMLRNGVPEIGWEGDLYLTLAYNKLEDKWEVWDTRPDGRAVLVMVRPAATLGDAHSAALQLCARLRDGDLRRKSITQILDEVDSHNDRVRIERDKKYRDHWGAAYERLSWALRKDGEV